MATVAVPTETCKALTLPMDESRGFRTVHRCTSRGPVQARQESALLPHSEPSPLPYRQSHGSRHPKVIRRVLVLTEDDHLSTHTRAACTASRSWHDREGQYIHSS
jgi:hypothetical protein